MKKPNITEGEWETMKFLNDDESIASITIDSGGEATKIIASLYNEDLYEDELVANAKAIKEVPNFIDSLIVAVEWMQWWLDEHECDCGIHHKCGRTERKHELSIMKDTLKKAGVEL